METPINDQTQADLLEDVIENLDAGSQEALTKQIESSHPAEVADLLESLPPGQRAELWEAVPTDQEGEVLTHLHEEARAAIVEEMGHEELVAAVQTMEPEGLAEVIEGLPEEQCSALLATLEQDHRQRLETILNFEDGTAGRLMSTDVISVRSDVTLAVVLRWLIGKEVAVGALNGLVWAIVVGAVAYVWFDSAGLAATIAAAMTVNLLIAALAGVVIPLVLTRFGIDPALSGAVVLTTVTDIVGFLSFLGLATLILL